MRLASIVVLSLVVVVPATANEGTIKQLKKGKPAERAEAAWNLGQWKVYAAIPDLIAALKDKDPYVRGNAAASLWAMADHASSAKSALKETLQDSNGQAVVNAAGALLAMNTPKAELIPPLEVVVAGRERGDAANAADLLTRLGKDPAQYVHALLNALDDPNPDVRREVITDIRQQKEESPAYIPVLLKALKDREESTRALAASELGDKTYATPEVVAALEKATSDRSEHVRSSATSSLQTVGVAGGARGSDVVATLLKSLQDRKGSVRAEAAESLGEMKKATPEIVAGLRTALTDKDKDVRNKAADAFAAIGKPAKEVVPDLWAIWNNKKEDTFVRHAAGRALGAMGEKVNWRED